MKNQIKSLFILSLCLQVSYASNTLNTLRVSGASGITNTTRGLNSIHTSTNSNSNNIKSILALDSDKKRAPAGSNYDSKESQNQLDLKRYWIQDRFIRAILSADTDEKKLLALDSLIALAEEYKSTKSNSVIEIASADELNHYRDLFLHPETSTQDEIQKFETRQAPPKTIITTTNMELAQKISEINAAYKKLLDREIQFPPKSFLTGVLKFFGALKPRLVSGFDLLFESSQDSNLTIKYIKNLSADEKLTYLNQMQSKAHELAHFVRNSGSRILETSNINIPNPVAKRFIELFLSEYFKNLPMETIWNIVFLQIERPEVSSAMDRFHLFSRNVGPHFHKLFQMVADQISNDESAVRVNSELIEVFKSFQENLPPTPKALINEELRTARFEEFEILEIDLKAKNVGSIGQVHKAKVKMKSTGQEKWMAIKIKKPGVDSLVAKDNEFIDRFVTILKNDSVLGKSLDGVNYTKLIEDLKKLVAEELDFYEGFKNQKLATKMLQDHQVINLESVNSKMMISVPEPYMSTNPSVMASEWIEGVSLDKLNEQNPELAKLVAEEVFKNWIQKSLLTNGFIHADMQMGNVKVELNSSGSFLKAHILDYGMAGTVSNEGRQLFLMLASGVAIKNPRLVARSVVDQPGNQTHLTLEEIENLAEEIFEKNRKLEAAYALTSKVPKKKQALEQIVLALKMKGFEFDSNFIKLARGYSTVSGLLISTKSEKKPNELLFEIVKNDPFVIGGSLGTLKHLKLTDGFTITKGAAIAAGTSVKNAFLDNPAGTIAAGAELIKKGRGFLGKLLNSTSLTSTISTSQNEKNSKVQCIQIYKK